MKKILYILLFFVSCNSWAQDEFIQEVRKSKQNIKNQIEQKDLNYDGAKTTYFEFNSTLQHKGVEVAIFLREKYQFFFDGTLAGDEVGIKIFDKRPQFTDRVLLYKHKNIAGGKHIVAIEDLQNEFAAQGGNPKLLSSLYIEYEIGKAEPSRGAVTVGLGF